MRLRTLSEAECYARCYGGRGEERVSFVRTVRTAEGRSEQRRSERATRLRELADRERTQEPGQEAA